MSKNRKCCTVELESASSSNASNPDIDWQKCILCQEIKSSEKLICPGNSKREDKNIGYKTLAQNLKDYSEVLPLSISLSDLDDTDGVAERMATHKACWHKTCRLKYNSTEIARAHKRKSSVTEKCDKAVKHARSKREVDPSTKEKCFFCEDNTKTEKLRAASTFVLDSNVRKCAHILQDQKLISKLSAGDLVAQDALYHASCLASFIW